MGLSNADVRITFGLTLLNYDAGKGNAGDQEPRSSRYARKNGLRFPRPRNCPLPPRQYNPPNFRPGRSSRAFVQPDPSTQEADTMADTKQDFPTILGPEATFKGAVSCENGMRLHGQLEGKVHTPGRLHI